MKLGEVIGHIWSTKKDENLNGHKFMVVKDIINDGSETFVAVDRIGAGIGDKVLITTGSSARKAVNSEAPVDAAIVGVVDEVDVEGRI